MRNLGSADPRSTRLPMRPAAAAEDNKEDDGTHNRDEQRAKTSEPIREERKHPMGIATAESFGCDVAGMFLLIRLRL
jgi:hypothetical protein